MIQALHSTRTRHVGRRLFHLTNPRNARRSLNQLRHQRLRHKRHGRNGRRRPRLHWCVTVHRHGRDALRVHSMRNCAVVWERWDSENSFLRLCRNITPLLSNSITRASELASGMEHPLVSLARWLRRRPLCVPIACHPLSLGAANHIKALYANVPSEPLASSLTLELGLRRLAFRRVRQAGLRPLLVRCDECDCRSSAPAPLSPDGR